MSIPRILIAGLRGGSGKTLVSLGVAAAWRKRGHKVGPYKKGPDYIDAAWLSMAAARPCRNLDLFLMSPEAVLGSFAGGFAGLDVAVIEGNRGLFDGLDAVGTCSTAELAKLLGTPVILAVDCTKSTRTIAALVLGCQRLDPNVNVAGVVLNRIGGPRHERVIREAIAEICGLSVLGVIRRIPEQLFPERHLGLLPPAEHGSLGDSIDRVAQVAADCFDLEGLWRIAHEAPSIDATSVQPLVSSAAPTSQSVRIGVFRDAAFQFYYPENLEALSASGAVVVEISPLGQTDLPEVDALYIGGGFPETAAPALAENRPFLDSLRRAIEMGLPVYAECGGAVFLGEKLLFNGGEHEMVGALPVVFAFQSKPRGHGYVELETVGDNPFYAVGQPIRGHEFHYTFMDSATSDDLSFAFRVRRGYGFDGRHDGLCHRNVLACYTHVHALGTDTWAPSLVRSARRFKATGGI